MKLNIKFLNCMLYMIAFLLSCCSQHDFSESFLFSNKTITGITLKSDGATFSKGSQVIAVSTSGNFAKGLVDEKGNFSVTLKGKGEAGKKFRIITGNTFLKVSDGINKMYLVIPHNQIKVNFNIITTVATQKIIDETKISLEDVFESIENLNIEDESGELNEQNILKSLALVQEVSRELFRDSAKMAIGTLFGFASSGYDSLDVDHFLTGSEEDKEISLIKVAASITENLFDSAVSATNNPNHADFYFNNKEYYQALGKELAEKDGVASASMFSDFLNSVIKSQEIKNALNEIADQLNAYVVEVEANPLATLDITIPQIAVSAPTFNITLTRDIDAVTYSISGGSIGDSALVTISVFDGTDIKALINLPITFNGSDLIAGTTLVTSTQDDISLEIKNTKAIVKDIIDLSIALSEAKLAFIEAGYDDISENLPESTSGLTLHVSCSPIKRSGVDNVSTYITSGPTTVLSITGIDLN